MVAPTEGIKNKVLSRIYMCLCAHVGLVNALGMAMLCMQQECAYALASGLGQDSFKGKNLL